MGKKINPDARPGEKLLTLFSLLLFDGREVSLTELAHKLDCSKQTVMRLINQLEASPHCKLLRAMRGREAVYRLDRPARLPKISLNAEGLYQLALCRDFMLHLFPDSMRTNMDVTLQQASAFLPEGNTPPESIGQSFAKGRIDYTPFQDILETLRAGIYERKVCVIRYKSALGQEAREYHYAPKRLIAFRDAIYLIGWLVCDKKNVTAIHETPTLLALQRMQKADLTRRTAEHLAEPEEDGKAFGVMAGEPFVARIRFDASAALYVAEREWSEGQKVTVHKNGAITLAMTARSPAETINWVLSFGDTAEVMSPKWLREAVRKTVHTLAARYAKGEQP